MKKPGSVHEVFSDKLEKWLEGDQHKTIHSLGEVFAEKSFAVVALLLMVLPALPLPTGGVTHVFEIVAAVLALECIAGLNTIWIPKRWKNLKVAPAADNKAIPMILKKIRWFENHSSPHWRSIFHHSLSMRVVWLLILTFTVFAFISPPFSGLDTLPSLGAVLICLAIIFEDAILMLVGTLIGVLGAVLTIGLGAVIVNFVGNLF
ncbi:MAG TPA: exopolysaccharide biosynthesis protein [Candidatus Saccharimonadales bacterium]|nr:exopolysaccharide biosynthesis protein [Candidatus Saccharimonadales bacterium]